MEGLFAFLLFAGLFYLMMRYGCGAHLVHGGHGAHSPESSGRTGHGGDVAQGGGRSVSRRDPVCGMEVAPTFGYSRMYAAREYRFCSRKCLDQFDAEPERYTSDKGVEP